MAPRQKDRIYEAADSIIRSLLQRIMKAEMNAYN